MPRGIRYPEQFKAEAVALYRSDAGSFEKLAADLGIAPESLRRWVRQDDIDGGRSDGLRTDERQELAALRKRVRILTEEREILKKAAAFFAAEPTR